MILHHNDQDLKQDEIVKKILGFCSIPRSRKEISDFVGMKDVRYLKEAYLAILIESGRIEMTLPEKPTSRNQKYVKIGCG